MRYDLVAADLDGTLLTSRNELTERTVQSVRRYQAAGGAFTIATGRNALSAMQFVERLGVCAPVVAFNGGRVEYPATGEVVYEAFLTREAAAGAFLAVRALGKDVVAYIGGLPYVAEATEVTAKYARRINHVPEILADPAADIGDNTQKLLVIDPALEFERVRAAIAPFFGGGGALNCVHSDVDFLEILPPGVSKGGGLLRAAERLGIAQPQTCAVGDQANDIPMLRAAGLGVAVANANPDVLAAAGYVTASNDEDGVAQLLDAIVAGTL